MSVRGEKGRECPLKKKMTADGTKSVRGEYCYERRRFSLINIG